VTDQKRMIAPLEMGRMHRARTRACKSCVALGANKMGTRITATHFAAIAALLVCAVAEQARGIIITVANTNDNGAGSLRDALTIATDGDTIAFAVTGPITLISDQLIVRKSVTINGPGANILGINGNGNHRVFFIRLRQPRAQQ